MALYKEDNYSTDLLHIIHNISDEPSGEFQLHCHTMYEILYILQGDIHYRIEGREYQPAPESILLIPPNMFHGVRINSSQIYHRFSIHFEAGFLDLEGRELLLLPFHQGGIYYPQASSFRLDHFYQSVLECFDLPPSLQDGAVRARVAALLTQVYSMYSLGGAQLPSPGRQIQQILHYVNTSIDKPIALEDLSRRFFISKNHLNVLFRQATGTTVNQYVRLKRLALAQKEILAGVPAGKAAEAAGFGDYTNFFRAYKAHYGYAPTESGIRRP